MSIDVLLIGSGGREHALAWKIAQSPELGAFFAAPGNPGIAHHAELADLDAGDHAAVVRFAREKAIDLVVVGPEGPLVAGLADALREAGILVFGPSEAAARLEGSKGFTKDLCTLKNIPTAAYGRFGEAEAAKAYIREQGAPIVVKADGLAAGKGVTVAMSLDEALSAVDACFAGEPGLGTEVVVEELLEGPEASLFCLCDGTRAVLFGTAEDHKRAFDGDEGPNTGGMGAYSPALALTPDVVEAAIARIVRPTLEGMREAGSPFSGILYAGLMMTADGPKLIEYNVRFGDPECQTLMMRLGSDILPILLAVAKDDLSAVEPQWRDEAAVCVVMAAKGYPGAYAKGSEIALPKEEAPDAVVFQAGTRQDGERLLADGGRVLGVTALGSNVGQARNKAYELVRAVEWRQGFFRSDIAHRALGRD